MWVEICPTFVIKIVFHRYYFLEKLHIYLSFKSVPMLTAEFSSEHGFAIYCLSTFAIRVWNLRLFIFFYGGMLIVNLLEQFIMEPESVANIIKDVLDM